MFIGDMKKKKREDKKEARTSDENAYANDCNGQNWKEQEPPTNPTRFGNERSLIKGMMTGFESVCEDLGVIDDVTVEFFG